ncbi:MAG: hypothetical protein U1E29_04950 [Coriobacteriia bacterium]|nr:hypothetical protein [Coriobacteriia bacterium]
MTQSALRFRKVPAFVLETLADRAFTSRELMVYLACIHLANYTAPRRVRASVATIAQAAGIHRQHATQALRSLARSTSERPAVIDYQPGVNQHATAVVTIIESPAACPVAVHAEDAACPETVHLTVHPTVQARPPLARETSPLEPRANRTSARSYDDEYLEQQALRIEQAHKRDVDRTRLALIASESDLPPARFTYAVTDLVSRPAGTVRSPLALLPSIVEDVRVDYAAELRATEFRNRPDCTNPECVSGHVYDPERDEASQCTRCKGSGKKPLPEQPSETSHYERNEHVTEPQL